MRVGGEDVDVLKGAGRSGEFAVVVIAAYLQSTKL